MAKKSKEETPVQPREKKRSARKRSKVEKPVSDKVHDKKQSSAVDTGLYSFVSLARFHEVSVDPGQIKHNLAIDAEPMSEAQILLAAKEVGLKARAAAVDFEKLKRLPLPLIAEKTNGDFFLLAQLDADKALILEAHVNAPTVIKIKEFQKMWNGRVILMVKRLWKDRDRKFGLKWFIPTIIKYKHPLIEVLIAAFVLQILGLFSPIITQVVIDKVLVHHSITTLNVIAIGLLLVAIFEMSMELARRYIFTHTTSQIDVMLGARLFKHLFKLPLRYFESRRVGDTIARVRELENIRQFLTGAPLTAILDVMFIFVYIIVMFFYSTSLTWIVLASLPFFIALSALVTPMFKRRLDEKFETGAEEQSYLVEAVSGVQTVKSFALEPKVQRKWEGLLSNYTIAGFKTALLAGNASAIGQFIQKVADIAILWYGAQLVISGTITVGQLIAFRMLSSRVSGPVLRLVQAWQDFQQAGISIKRLGDIFNSKPEPTLDASKARLPRINGHIKFEKVRFRYRPDGAEVIRDLTFAIPPGAIVGIVGRSGSGKSTISKLMQRLYIPEGGKILIDGVDLTLTDPAWLRTQIGVVLQENFLFNASVKDNIAVHNPAANMEEVVRVAKIAGAHEFILELPEAYDTIVGERGTSLSGGQKQRIAIARALLHNPRILIFDEATSALDYESESIIQKNLQQICQGRTVIIIAHRLSTLKDANLIMAVDRGQLVEYGTKEDLMKRKGLYYYLHSQQEKGEVS